MKEFAVSAEEIAKWIGAEWVNSKEFVSSAPIALRGLSVLRSASQDQVAFFFNPAYKDELLTCRAGVLITGLPFVKPLLSSQLPLLKTTKILACEDPYSALAVISKKFSSEVSAHDHQATGAESVETCVHPTAIISENVAIGKGVIIYPHVYIGPDCVIGDGTVLFANVSIYQNTRIGKNCRIHSGAVLGADGFGYAPKMANGKPIAHQKIFHLGGVLVGDDVEIGANSTIDRGTMGDTIIGSQCKIDNLVQVGHNCVLGEGTVLCGQSGLAGTGSTGKFVYLGGQAAIGNNVHVGDYSRLGAFAGAAKDIPPESDVAGIPARPAREHFKLLAMMNRMLNGRSRQGKAD